MKKLFVLASVWLVFASCNFKVSVETKDADSASQDSEQVAVVEPIEEANGKVQLINQQQYDQFVAHLNNPDTYIGFKPCIVDFYADWCGPCKRLSPIMDKLAAKYKGKVTFLKVDVDKNEKLSNVYAITSIPNLFFCSNGKITPLIGFMPEEDIEKKISDMLSSPMR